MTAPDTVMLRHGVENLAQQINWTKIGGRISAYNREKQSVENLPVQNIVFLSTQPLSFTNIRLITTNWLSSNALSYVVLLMIALVALGLS
ncbi:cellulose biosynthesis cyclic di-GMP-binding regulatory protein BcsB, partial [Ochrobactrum sp. GRS2]|nr:cellulose biosynthesis cyclic di-GMP-binding regulatory protein BcsB [Ochrobactrum sp. GRS2]